MAKVSLGCWLTTLIGGAVLMTICEGPGWLLPGGGTTKNTSAEILKEASSEVLEQGAKVRTIHVTGTLKRELWNAAGKVWIYDGENTSTCVYEYEGDGRARVECTRDVQRPAVAEGISDFVLTEFTAVAGERGSETLITRAGGLQSPPEGKPTVELEKGRTARMEIPDQASGWRYVSFWKVGRRGIEPYMIFTDVLDGKGGGFSTVSAADYNGEELTLVRVVLSRKDLTQVYFLDENRAYAIWKWQEYENLPDGKTGRLLRDATMPKFWVSVQGIYYPSHIDARRFGPDGTAVERETIEVTDFATDEKVGGAELEKVALPAGALLVKQGGKDTPLTGSAQENAAKVLEMQTHPAP